MSADQLFDNYQRNRFKLAKAILTSSKDELLSLISRAVDIDNDCRRAMGSGEYRSPYSCKGCTDISSVTSMRSGPIKSFEIEAGEKSGENMLVVKDDNPLTKVELDTTAMSRYHQLEQLVGICGERTHVDGFISIGTWLNGIVMSYLIEYILNKENIPHCLPINVGFQCARTGYSIRLDEHKLVDYDESMSSDTCRSIIQQIAITLKVLSKYSFIHGSATIDRLYIDSFNDCSYEHLGYHIVGEFILKIAEYHFSSMTVNTTRLFPHTLGRNVNIKSAIDSFAPVVERKSISMYNIEDDTMISSGDTLFKVQSDSSTLFTTMRYSGYPLFGGAYDMYSFFLSLMSWTPFAKVVKSDQDLTKLWISMFPDPDEVPNIKPNEKGITCSYQIAECLRGKWLYCNVIDQLLSKIENQIVFASDSE